MELYPCHFKALGNGRQTSMERLNDILGRIPQHRQQKMEHDDPSLQSQEISPSRYTTREQTSHSGSGSRSSQTHYQHKIPQRVRYEQGKYSQQGAYSRQQSPASGISYQQGLKHQVDIDGHTQHDEDFVPSRDRSRGSTGITSADSVDVYSTMAGSDVREEWDDDTGDMLYGDWEDDGNDTNLRFNPQVTGTVVHERNSMYQAPARDTQTYHENNRSFVTRDLHMTSNGDSRSQATRR